MYILLKLTVALAALAVLSIASCIHPHLQHRPTAMHYEVAPVEAAKKPQTFATYDLIRPVRVPVRPSSRPVAEASNEIDEVEESGASLEAGPEADPSAG